MHTRRLLPLVSLGLAFATISASTAEAQRRTQVTVCRDGTRYESNAVRVCDRHRGVDARATENARRYEADRVANGRRDDRRNDPRYDPRYDPRAGDARAGDPRFDPRAGDPRYDPRSRDPRRDGRYEDGRNEGRYGSGRNQVYEWYGTVDREIQIQIRGNRAAVQRIGAGEMRTGRGRVVNGLPQRNGLLVVERLEGRGSVEVISHPNSRNGYTATLRVRDPQGGAAPYRIVAYWQPDGDSRYDDRRYGGY